MNRVREIESRRQQAGTALLIAIFALLLISIVGIALLVSTSADTALAGNYRTSTEAYYAALAGLEEARGRLLWKNPAYIGNTVPNFVQTPGGPPLAMNTVLYILNPNTAIGENVAPTDPSNPYADKEYDSEFSPTWPLSNATVYFTNSVSPAPSASPPLPGPSYKWVRINPITESALGIDVDKDGSLDPLNVVYFDPANVDTSNNPRPGLVVPSPTPTPTSVQALEITALAVMPSGSTKLLQYIVTPASVNMSFPAALLLDGVGVSYVGPSGSGSDKFYVNGNVAPPCVAPPLSVPAIGFVASVDYGNINNSSTDPGMTANAGNYEGVPAAAPNPATPSVVQVQTALPPAFLTPSRLDALARAISQNADASIVGTPVAATRSSLPTGMSPTNPMTTVVNGDLDLRITGPRVVGYGVLLVTGTLYYDADISWEGVILVVGTGAFKAFNQGSGRIDGAVVVAQTRDAAGNLLPDPNLGPASVNFDSSFEPTTGPYNPLGPPGIYYNPCIVTQSLAPTSYRVLSFREITQQ